jgi:hypothetical protein
VSEDRSEGRVPAPAAELEASERELVRALRTIRYGSIEAVVHAGRIVHFERRERVRFADPNAGGHTSETQRHDRIAGGPLDPTKGTNDGTSQDELARGARRAGGAGMGIVDGSGTGGDRGRGTGGLGGLRRPDRG